jgi:hypothetical protein
VIPRSRQNNRTGCPLVCCSAISLLQDSRLVSDTSQISGFLADKGRAVCETLTEERRDLVSRTPRIKDSSGELIETFRRFLASCCVFRLRQGSRTAGVLGPFRPLPFFRLGPLADARGSSFRNRHPLPYGHGSERRRLGKTPRGRKAWSGRLLMRAARDFEIGIRSLTVTVQKGVGSERRRGSEVAPEMAGPRGEERTP